MNTNDKPRADARLKNLPEERQFEIEDYVASHTLNETVTWLGASGVEVSSCALSRFLAWQRLRRQMAKNELVVKELLEEVAEQHPELSPERVMELGQVFFSSMALEQQDPRVWCLVQQTGVRKAHFELEFKKYYDQVQARKEAIQRELDTAKSKGGLSAETIEKIEHELNLF